MSAAPVRLLTRPLPADAAKRYRFRQDRGLPSPLVDNTAVLAHIEKLTGWGLSCASISEAAGVSECCVRQVRRRDGGRVYSAYAAAILSVSHRPTERQVMVLAVGVRRRINALMLDGYSMTDLAGRVGVYKGSDLRCLIGSSTVRRETYTTVAALYAELAGTPGLSARARSWARKAGHAGRGAWDEDTIDDPDATPAEWERRTSVTIHGEDIEFLLSAAGGSLTIGQIADRWGADRDTVTAALRRYHLRDNHWRAKISGAQVAELRAAAGTGPLPKAAARVLAASYNVSVSTVYNIISGRARPDLTETG